MNNEVKQINNTVSEVINLLTELGWKYKIDKGTLSFVFRQEVLNIYHDLTGELRISSDTMAYDTSLFTQYLRISLIEAYEKVDRYEN